MIQEAFTYVEQTPDLETKLKLIDTLRTVTAGKVIKLHKTVFPGEVLAKHYKIKIISNYLPVTYSINWPVS